MKIDFLDIKYIQSYKQRKNVCMCVCVYVFVKQKFDCGQ